MKFTVYGNPVAKGRPRFSSRGGYVRSYTPVKTVNYENLVKLSYTTQVEGSKLEGGLYAEIIAFFPIPKSTSKKNAEKMRSFEIMHTKKCDCDNLAKAILDALNGIAYDDDAQICSLLVKKLYGDVPRVEIEIGELENGTIHK